MRIDLEFGEVGFWREEKTGKRREKPLGKEENNQPTYPFIYLKNEKGTPFSRSLPIKVFTGSTPPPGKQASALTTAPPLRSFRRKPIQLLYLYKKVSGFISISLIHNNYFAKLTFVPVNFLIGGNVTLGLMFAVCRKRDSKSLDFPLND